MKITKLIAVNFAGIKIGTGRNSIVVDFSKNKNPLCLLLGGNGKGKTSLLSILHPLRGTNDNRNPIIKDKDTDLYLKGYKEVHITEKTDEYRVQHLYNPNKSFIQKNGKELNNNGNITSFNQILKEELGVDESYFKVGRLGNNVTNFINLKSADRKKFIGNFLPNIDEDLMLFELVKTKYSLMNKELNNIATQLGKLPEIDNIMDKVLNLKKQINELSEGITGFEKQKTVQEFSMNQILEQFKSINIDLTDKYSVNNIKSESISLQTKLEHAETIIKQYTEKYPNLANYNDKKIEETIIELDVELNNIGKSFVKYETEYNNTIQSHTDIKKRITVTQSKIKEDVTEEIDKLQKLIQTEESRLAQLDERIAVENPEIFNYTIPDINKIKFKASKILDMIVNNIILNYNFTNYDLSLLSKYEVTLNDIELYSKQLNEVNKFIIYCDNNKTQLDALKKRDTNCTVNTCSFIVNSLQFKDTYYDKLDSYIERKSELETKLDSLNKLKDEISEIINFTKACDECVKEFNDLANSFIKDSFITEQFDRNSFIKFLSNGTSAIEKTLNVDFFYDVIQMKNDLEITKNKLDTLHARQQNLCSQQENVKIFKEELTSLKEESLNLDEQIKSIIIKKTDIVKQENTFKSKRTILSQLKQSREISNSISNELKESQDLLYSIEEAINKVNEHNSNFLNFGIEIERNNKIKESLDKEKVKNEKDLNYLEVLMDNKKVLDEKFNYTKLVKESLDPKKGIPLLFIDNFLQSITEKTNNLLDLAYKNSFRISFDLTEKDFFIRVHRMFSDLEDITQSSQGETSMTMLSLSLSMIENMIKKYNIIYLDEIDSTLSTENRRMFLNMLEKQLLDLGIEQIFIISHNNEFYSYPVDLILFDENEVDINDREFMLNKNIIFNIEDDFEEVAV